MLHALSSNMEPRIISFKPKSQFGYLEDAIAADKDAGPPINNMDSIASVLALTSSSSSSSSPAPQQHKQPQQYPPQSSLPSLPSQPPPPPLQTSTPSRTSAAKTSSSSSSNSEAVVPQHHHGLPPTFSRLPPDGHEFPPNFSDLRAVKIADDAPPLPKSGPPSPPASVAGTRKVYRQDLVISVEDTRHTTADSNPQPDSAMVVQSAKKTWSAAVLEDKNVRKEIMITAKNGHLTTAAINGDAPSHCSTVNNVASALSAQPSNGGAIVDHRRRSIEQHDAFKKFDAPRKQIGALPTNWRKDEKSEKSVRDKIAMFSVEAQLAASGADVTDAAATVAASAMPARRALSSYALNRSTENLLSSGSGSHHSHAAHDSSPPFGHKQKAQSVEHLDELMSCTSLSSGSSRYGSSYDYAAYMADSVGSGSGSNVPATKPPSKAFSVENLHQSYGAYRSEAPPSTPKRPQQTPDINTNIPASYASLPRTKPPTVARTTSFSGASAGSYEDRRRSSINSLLEQRKKSMSKLRGLIIPEKMAVGPGCGGGPVLHDLPEIRSKQSTDHQLPQQQQHHHNQTPSSPSFNSKLQREPVVPNPMHYTPAYQTMMMSASSSASPAADLNTGYKSIFGSGSMLRSTAAQNSTINGHHHATPKRPPTASAVSPSSSSCAYTMPPIKPPRTSLILAGSRSSSDHSHKSYAALDDSDSDSVFSSKISSPPGSPVVRAPPGGGKFALTRTLSSETNTSIASSTTSTLTSGSGSQASCSSVGSTPTVDMSRKISKSSSNESYVNRKNILALAKCRSGKDENTGYGGMHPQHHHHHQHQPPQLLQNPHQLGMRPHQQRRGYEDEDSTDGYDEDEQMRLRHAPKPKQRGGAVGNGSVTHHRMVIQAPVNSVPVSQPINYRLVSSADNLVDMVINVASYVEVVTSEETDGDSKHSSSDNTYSPSKVNTQFAIDEERLASLKAAAASVVVPKVAVPVAVAVKIAAVPVSSVESVAVQQQQQPPNDMAKWVRSEASRSAGKAIIESTVPLPVRESSRQSVAKKPLSVSANIQMFNKTGSADAPKLPITNTTTMTTATATSVATPVPLKITASSPETKPVSPRKNIENSGKISGSYHERFSSLDSLASTSSSSGISSSQASSLLDPSPLIGSGGGAAPSVGSAEFDGSYSSFGSNHSLITPADLQLIIEEADPPLRRPEAFVVVLQRESPECSVGVTLAGGADYETKEITIYRVLSNSPAYKDGRLRKGDRILSVNGLSMRGLTHRESVTVLKTPRLEVVMVVTRSESVRTQATAAAVDAAALAKSKRASLGSLTSLHEKQPLLQQQQQHHQNSGATNGGGVVVGNGTATAAAAHKSEEGARRKMAYHKLSQSLEMDLDMMSNEGSSIYDEGKSVDGADDSTGSSMGDDAVFGVQSAAVPMRSKSGEGRGRIVEIYKDNCGLGLAIEGGQDSPSGHCPLTVKKVFMGGAAEKTGQVSVGDVIVAINDFNTEQVTRVQAWNYMKSLPGGAVKFCLA